MKTKKKTYTGYSGHKAYLVRHPDHKRPLQVTAPDEASAIVAAADYWGARWQDLSFYGFCTVSPVPRKAVAT